MANFEPKQFGKYLLLEKLAVGGMAEIYKAKTYGAEGFEKLLAIKRILPHAAADKEFITMLIDEAKLSVLLSHANIVQVYDLGKVGEDYFISMEYIHGVNLRDVLYHLREKNKKMPTDLAVYVTSEICKGLDYAHRKADSNNQSLGIVHRDISPQNILISFEGEVKIVDFGIAKAAMNISHTMAGILKGKIAYMSPEQAMGKAIDARTDIFSVGILLYETLTGKKLYTGESQFEVLKKIRTTRIETGKLPESIPESLKPILVKALAYRPEDRYASAGDLQIALTKYLYATFTDFSPRKLSVFVKEVLLQERQKETSTDQKGVESKTGSISLLAGTGVTQENIVHRETTPLKAKVKLSVVDETRPVEIEKSITASRAQAKRHRFPVIPLLSILLVLGIGFAAWKIFKQPAPIPEAAEKPVEKIPAPPPTPPKKMGILSIISDPSGAAILVNGIATGKATPATLENLDLNTEYKIGLSKPDYIDFNQNVTLSSAAPQKILASLKPIPQNPPPQPATQQPVTSQPKTPAAQTPAPTPTQPPVEEPKKEILGSLQLNSNPLGAHIFLNGKDTGKTTPARIADLQTGRYTVKLVKENFQPVVRVVNVASNKQYSVKEKLKQIEQQPPPTIRKKPEAEKVPPASKETPAQAGGEGAIRISSNPSDADIFVNGEHLGMTPATVKTKSGSVRILVTKGEDRLPCREVVQVKAGETASFNCTLGALFGKIEINTTPPRADVYLDGKKLGGKTPLTVEKIKRDKAHTLRLELDGFKPWERSFDLEDKESKLFNIDLEK